MLALEDDGSNDKNMSFPATFESGEWKSATIGAGPCR